MSGLIEEVGAFQRFFKQPEEVFTGEELEEAELLIKYESYISKEREVAEKLEKLNDFKLGEDLDYSKMPSLSLEAREKLNKIKPRTIGQASRISGVSPADISVLIVFMGRK